MAKHEITIHENKSVTKEVTPYTGTYISKETFRIENFKAKLDRPNPFLIRWANHIKPALRGQGSQELKSGEAESFPIPHSSVWN